MIDRVPVAPQHKGERLLTRLVRDVNALKRRPTGLLPDEQGRYRIGDVYFIFTTDPATQQIRVQLQNAITLSPPYTVTVLP
jgi:hypothetical protein